MVISKIRIQNFRSIQTFTGNFSSLNILVGRNDEGKSNVLRALDLFFNGDRGHGFELDWMRDYCSFAPKRKQKAEEIVIELEIVPPPSFKSSKSVQWRKVWRKDGLYLQQHHHTDGKPFETRSKLLPFLKAIRYDYVPAIKGPEYFRTLMTSLHDMLEATVEQEVRRASGSFTETINENTQSILEDIASRLGLTTTIALPPNLRDLFAELEFTSLSGDKPFSLAQRGDGIKVRHVPIVLRWLAKQANHLSAPGRPKVVTIWGYEEPENNLELQRCFELARELREDAESIQTFVTTHSPAFYSVAREGDAGKVRIFHVTKGEDPPTTGISSADSVEAMKSLDSAMGLLEFLKPHFQQIEGELAELRKNRAALQDTSTPSLFCEGPSDKVILEAALRSHFPEYADKLAILCSEDGNGGGHGWVTDRLMAWSYSRPTARAVGLYDADEGANQSARKVKDRIVAMNGKQPISVVTLVKTAPLIACARSNFPVPYAIEELMPKEVWDHAEEKDWLEERTNPIQLYNFSKQDVTFVDYAATQLADKHHHRLALMRVKSTCKEKFSKYVTGLPDDRQRDVLVTLKPTLEKCLSELKVGADQ